MDGDYAISLPLASISYLLMVITISGSFNALEIQLSASWCVFLLASDIFTKYIK